MKVIGKIYKVEETIERGTFATKPIIVETEEQYPQFIKIEFHQNNIDLIDKAEKGDKVEIDVNLRGRAWTNKEGVEVYFNSIVGWKVKTQPTENQDKDSVNF